MAATAISTVGTIIQLYIIFVIPIFVPILFHFIYDWKEHFLIYALLTFITLIYYIKNAFMFSNSFSEVILKNRDILNQKDENLKKTEEILKQKDENLKKTEEILKQRELLQQQSKMAMMGEMIGSIAHQWRQPLNELTISIQMLEYTPKEKLLDKDFLKKFTTKNKKLIDFMSETIDDFRNFFRIDKEKELFKVKDTIESTISILNAQLSNHSIDLKVSGDDFEINSFKGEFQQVILNIINNAKDALIENSIKEKQIEIILKEDSNSQKSIKRVVIIKDNAGGIPENIINRIFEPYFTTKEQGKGTGIGLYISKMIIENNMNSTLSVKNIDSGAQFTIEFHDR
jgi:signal transduction histidine kinase